MYTCLLCGEKITKGEQGEAVYIKKRFAHRNCFDFYNKQLSDKKLIKQAEKAIERRKIKGNVVVKGTSLPETETETLQKKAFQATVKRITGEKPRVAHNAYARKLIKDYKLTYKDIDEALQFFYEVMQEVPKGESNLLGIVPYVVDRSRLYFARLGEAIEANRHTDTSDFYKTECVVQIIKQEIDPREQLQLIDLSRIGVGDSDGNDGTN